MSLQAERTSGPPSTILSLGFFDISEQQGHVNKSKLVELPHYDTYSLLNHHWCSLVYGYHWLTPCCFVRLNFFTISVLPDLEEPLCEPHLRPVDFW